MPRTHRRILIALTGVAVVAAVCAIAVIVVTQMGSDTPANESASDSNIEYPEALSDILFVPGPLAIDPQSGDLWFAKPARDNELELLRYSADEGTISTRTVPASAGQFLSIAVDSTGRVITAQGSTVRVIDHEHGGYAEHRITA